MEKIDQAAAKRIAEAALGALRPIAEEMGLGVEVKGGKFDPHLGTFNPKIEFSIGGIEQAGKRLFALMAPEFGLRPEDYGAEITIGIPEKRYRITGLNPRAKRYPIEAEDVEDGKRFKLPEAAVASLKREERPSEKAMRLSQKGAD